MPNATRKREEDEHVYAPMNLGAHLDYQNDSQRKVTFHSPKKYNGLPLQVPCSPNLGFQGHVNHLQTLREEASRLKHFSPVRFPGDMSRMTHNPMVHPY